MAGALSVVIVGTGNRSIGHMDAVDAVEGMEVSAGVDPEAAQRQRFQERYRRPAFDDIDRLLREDKPDMVAICTKEYPRHKLTMAAIAGGVKAIVLEKPLARTVDEAREMVAAAEAAGTTMIVCHQMRFSDEFVAAKRAIDTGEVGTPYYFRASSYGQLMEQGPHMVDMLLYMASDPEVEWVMGAVADIEEGRSTVHPAPAFVVGYVSFAGGLRAVVECGRRFQRAVGLEDVTWLQKRVQALGTEGMVDAVVAHHCRLLNSRARGWQTLTEGSAGWDGATIRMYEELRDVLLHGGVHRNNAQVSLKGFEIVHGIYQSALNRDRAQVPIDAGAFPLEKIMGAT